MRAEFPKSLQKILPEQRCKEFGLDHPRSAGQIAIAEVYGIADAALLAFCQTNSLRISIHAEGQHTDAARERTMRVVIFRPEDRDQLEHVKPHWRVSNPWAVLDTKEIFQ